MEIGERLKGWARPIYSQFSELVNQQVEQVGEPGGEGETDIIAVSDSLLRDAVRGRASDIHLEPDSEGIRVRFRIDGILLDTMMLESGTGWSVLRHIKAMFGLDPVPAVRPASTGRQLIINGAPMDIRASVAPCVFGEKVTLRLLNLPQQIQQIGRLGMEGDAEAQIHEWSEQVAGTFIVCGPTGSGKTTTLYALLHELRGTNRSVVTIEDPVEYRIDGITQLEVHERNLSFTEGLRASLRLDPDCLMLGEIRDPETARVAMTAAGTGRVLMTTLHSKDAVGSLTALRNWGIDNYQIASALRVIVAQRLVRRLCEYCREPADGPTTAEREWLEAVGREVPEELWKPGSCERCGGLGYNGRSGIFEIWRVGASDADLILSQADDQSIRRELGSRGHQFMMDDAMAKVAKGVTDLRQVRYLTSGGG
ncbi:MAG: GspE/PulE family protein [Pseudomonadota bacterium]